MFLENTFFLMTSQTFFENFGSQNGCLVQKKRKWVKTVHAYEVALAPRHPEIRTADSLLAVWKPVQLSESFVRGHAQFFALAHTRHMAVRPKCTNKQGHFLV